MALFKKIAQDPNEGRGNTRDCPTCNGSGDMPDGIRNAMPVPPPAGTNCTNCNGTGKVHR